MTEPLEKGSMHIKNISWSLQQALQGQANVGFRRSHGY